MHGPSFDNVRPEPDQLLQTLADYVCGPTEFTAEAYTTARHCLMDTLGCGFLALGFPNVPGTWGPIVPGATLPGGARVPGTSHHSTRCMRRSTSVHGALARLQRHVAGG